MNWNAVFDNVAGSRGVKHKDVEKELDKVSGETLEAYYECKCPVCGGRIHAGDVIVFIDGVMVCGNCKETE